MLNPLATDEVELENEAKRAQRLMIEYGKEMYHQLVRQINQKRLEFADNRAAVLEKMEDEWLDFKEARLRKRGYKVQENMKVTREESRSEGASSFAERAAFLEMHELHYFGWY